MADDKLRDEYERLLFEMKIDGAISSGLHHRVLLHILRRLGPPEPLDGIEAEKLSDAGN